MRFLTWRVSWILLVAGSAHANLLRVAPDGEVPWGQVRPGIFTYDRSEIRRYFPGMTRSDGASPPEGGRYGNWYGPGWSGGQASEDEPGTQPPVDALDTAAMRHDLAYQVAADQGRIFGPAEETRLRDIADVQLMQEAAQLDPDPSKWSPPARDPEAARRGREGMLGTLLGGTSTQEPEWMTSPSAGWPQPNSSRMNERQLAQEVEQRRQEWYEANVGSRPPTSPAPTPAVTQTASVPTPTTVPTQMASLPAATPAPAHTPAATAAPAKKPTRVRKPSQYYLGAPDIEDELGPGGGTPPAAGPGAAVSPGGPSGAGGGTGPGSGPTSGGSTLGASALGAFNALRESSPWFRNFAHGVWVGARDAIPKLAKSIWEHPIATAVVMVPIIVIAAVSAEAATAIAVGVTVIQVVLTKGDPEKLGEVLGENLVFIGAGKALSSIFSGLKGRLTGTPAASSTGAAEGAAGRVAAEVGAAEGAAGRVAAGEAGAEGAVQVAKRPPLVELPVRNPLCFVAGTRILTATGDSPIEEVRPGDEVLTWSPSGHRRKRHWLASTLASVLFAQPAGSLALPSTDLPPRIATFDRAGRSVGFRATRELERQDLIRIGDRLWRVLEVLDGGAGFHLQESDLAISRVRRTFHRQTHAVIALRAHHPSGEVTVITGTAEHPFYVPSLARWIEMEDLAPGMDVATSTGISARVSYLASSQSPQFVYNFEVDLAHNYFVGDASNSPALLAHNQCTGDKIKSAATSLVDEVGVGGAAGIDAAAAKLEGVLDDALNQLIKIHDGMAANPVASGQRLPWLEGMVKGARSSVQELRDLASLVGSRDSALAKRLLDKADELEIVADESQKLLDRVRVKAGPPLGGTRPTGKAGDVANNLSGPKTPPEQGANARFIELENLTSEELAKLGYKTQRNPTKGLGKKSPRPPDSTGFQPADGKSPDLLVEGRYFDVYSPSGHDPARILRHVSESKIGPRQSERVILNLTDVPVTPREIEAALALEPISALKELWTLVNGTLTKIFPS